MNCKSVPMAVWLFQPLQTLSVHAPLAHPTPVILAPSMATEQSTYAPASGPLHMQFPLPRMPWPGSFHFSSLSSNGTSSKKSFLLALAERSTPNLTLPSLPTSWLHYTFICILISYRHCLRAIQLASTCSVLLPYPERLCCLKPFDRFSYSIE